MTETHKEMDVKPWEWVEGEHGYSTLCDATNKEIITTGGYNDGDYPVVWMGEEMTDEHKELIAQAPVTKANYEALLSAYAGMKEALEFYGSECVDDLGDGEFILKHALFADAGKRARDALSALPTGETEKPICWAQQNGLADDVERIANTVGSADHPNEAHELATIAYLMRTPKTAPGVSALQEENARLREALAFYAAQWECDPSDKMVPSIQLEEDTGSRAVAALSQKAEGEAS